MTKIKVSRYVDKPTLQSISGTATDILIVAGIAMLRVVDPKLRSGTLEDFGLAYIPVTPVEITAVTFVPALVIAGAAWAVVGIWGAIALGAIIAGLFIARANRREAATTAP